MRTRSLPHSRVALLAVVALLLAAILSACGAAATATSVPPTETAVAPTVAPSVAPETSTEAPAATQAPAATAAPAPSATTKPTEAAAAGGEKVKISVAGWGPGEETFKPSWQMFKESFEAVNPNITVELVGIPYENLRTQLITQGQAGNPPDIAQVDSRIDGELAAMGLLAPWDDLLTPEFKADVLPSMMQAAMYNGKLFSVPQSPGLFLVFANKDLREKAGFTKAPETLKEFEEQITAIAALGKTPEGNKIWGFSPDTTNWVVASDEFLSMAYNFGASEADADGKLSLNSPEMVKAMAWYQDMVKKGVLGPPGVDIREMRKLFALGQTGFHLDTSGGVGIVNDLSGKGKDFMQHYETMPFPAGEDGKHWGAYYAHTFVLFNASKHKEEAAKFVQFITSDPVVTKKYMDAVAQPPPMRSLLADPSYAQDPVMQTILKQIENVRKPFALWPEHYNELSDVLSKALEGVALGTKDAKAALDEAQQKGLEIIGK